MKWELKGAGESYMARKMTGTRALIRRLRRPPEGTSVRAPAYEVNYQGRPIAAILFEEKGAVIIPLELKKAYPEITALDLVEMAFRLGRLREAAGNALN